MSEEAIILRNPYVPEDWAEWGRLRQLLWPGCPAERLELERRMLEASGGLVVLAYAGARAVGFAEASVRREHVEGTVASPVAYLEGWYVESGSRQRGVGQRLLEFVECWARGQGLSELASDAELSNDPSIRIHQSLGFREVGRSVHFVKSL